MKLQPLDKITIPLMLLLCLLIGALAWSGDHAAARVRDFTWQDKDVGAVDRAFILNFSRPMDHASVEANLKIAPPLPGKISWAGRRLAYTLTMPPPYGEKFQLTLQGGKDRLSSGSTNQRVMQPFSATFYSRDRAFAYIGVKGDETGRLVLSNLTKQTQDILTPKHLLVTSFKIFPDAQRILFSAIDRTNKSASLLDQQLYTVTTGITVQAPPEPGTQPSSSWQAWWMREKPPEPIPAKLITRLLGDSDYQRYQLQQFDLAIDGKTLVIKRGTRQKTSTAFGIWAVALDTTGTIIGNPTLLSNKATGEFSITPDGGSLAISEGQGLAITPITPNAKPLDFLPKFGQLLSFAQDGTKALTVKFNTDYTRSLFLVTNQGQQTELLKIAGSILSAVFDPTGQFAYCILTKVVPGKTYQEQPFLAMINLKTQETIPLLALPQQLDIAMSLSPDGLGLLLDQITPQKAQPTDFLITRSGQAIADSQLWLLPIVPGNPQVQKTTPPEKLLLAGIRPQWLP